MKFVSVSAPVHRSTSDCVFICLMSLTGTQASPYGRFFVALLGSPFSALPSSAVQLLPAWISLMRSRTYCERASTVHLSLGTKVRLRRSDAFVWSLGWIEP